MWTALWLSRGSYLTAAIVLGLTVWSFGFAVYFLYTTLHAAKPRAEHGAAGTVIRADKIADVSFIAATTAVFVAALLYLVFAPFSMIDYVPTGVMRTAVPVGCGFLVAFGAPTLYRMFKHQGGGHLRVNSSGFAVWNGQWGTFRRGTWDEIEQILDHSPRGRTPFNEVIVFVLPKGRSAMLMADAITGNTAALRDWVRFYWQHPEFRDELVDGRGLQRLDDEKFTAE
ncbi:hypothetical protein GCM10027535_00790 [Mycolicibacterium hippocampi]|uniref:Uncharacterized protein n=1 Tax=Mycolicibacterium hippocampi TaxID=659824 RepID=A0A7I9ZFH9_9MYCO|nr:hypothetical protein MHIP_02650 [Mycolicibacterium hippocampi]